MMMHRSRGSRSCSPPGLAALLAILAGCSTGQAPGDEGGKTTGDPGGGPGSFTGTGPQETGQTSEAPPTTGEPGETSTGEGSTTLEDSSTGEPAEVLCRTEFRYDPPPGATKPRIAGEWQGFDLASATALDGPDGDGFYSGSVELAPGLHAYKVVQDQGGQAQWVLDRGQGRRKYVDGIENSAVLVRDCRLPALSVESSAAARPGPGAGSYAATLRYIDGLAGAGADAGGYTATLQDNFGVQRQLDADELKVDANSGDVTLALAKLGDGKQRVTITARSADGAVSEPLLLVFWIEAEAFTWEGALVYMVMTDRFVDGAPGNNPGPTPKADPRGDWKGGDLEGVRARIADGTLDQLGVRAIWLTPFQTNPAAAYPASDDQHWVTGYHGYWPISAREVDPRLGGAAALKAMVREAHKHGIRVLQDYVINHVHEEHEYVAAHPEWFRTGCVCGTDNCGWTEKALECMFAPYLPDINHAVPAANAAFVEDAVFWLDEFDLDGLRVDAVKHVEEVATRNLASAVRETFEPAGTQYFLMGETAMGWSENDNVENYDTIARYIGPFGLDGQFDFVLYHAASYRTFAHGDTGMLHADYWTQDGLKTWPKGAVMTPYIGSHDTPRFVTLADYRGQDGAHDKGIPGNQWSNTAQVPNDLEPQLRMRIAMAWMLGLPGAPLLYYGDEYGEWGGADPNNRAMWRASKDLSAAEATTQALVRKLGKARRELGALRRGDYLSLYADEDTLVYARRLGPGDAAIVALTRAKAPVAVEVEVGAALGFAPQTALTDRLGGAPVIVGGPGTAAFTIPASGAVLLAP